MIRNLCALLLGLVLPAAWTAEPLQIDPGVLNYNNGQHFLPNSGLSVSGPTSSAVDWPLLYDDRGMPAGIAQPPAVLRMSLADGVYTVNAYASTMYSYSITPQLFLRGGGYQGWRSIPDNYTNTNDGKMVLWISQFEIYPILFDADGIPVVPGDEDAPYRGPCPDPDRPNPDCQECAAGANADPADSDSVGYSLIDNLRLSHLHFATDYTVRDPGDNPSCRSCVQVPTERVMPSFQLVRVHRYRDMDWHGSFGPGVFCNYDVQMVIDRSSATIEYFDPLRKASYAFSRTAPGTWTFRGASFDAKHITMYDAGGALTDDPADALTAVLTLQDGMKRHFEVFSTGGGTTTDFVARQTRITDRFGNDLDITYVDQARSAAAGDDPGSAWRIASITDAYGRRATFSYGRADGQWVIRAIHAPNGSTISYAYAGSMVGVNAIGYPDGTASQFTTAYDRSRDQQQVTYADAGAEGEHRNASIWISNGTFGGPFGANVVQPWNRIRRVANGNGEESYRNWVTDTRLVAEDGQTSKTQVHVRHGNPSGAARIIRYEVNRGAVIGVSDALEVPSWSRPPSLYARRKTMVGDSTRSLLSRTRPDGHGVRYVRNAQKQVTGTYLITPNAPETRFMNRTLNENSEPIEVTDALGRITSYVYNQSRDRLLSMTLASGSGLAATTSYAYNGRGQVTAVTDPLNRTVERVFDPRGYLVSERQPADIPGGPRPTTTWERDDAGRLTAAVDPVGNRTVFAYDVRNRVTRITYADSGYETFAYGTSLADANLLVEHRLRNGGIERFSYDAQGRKTRQALLDPQSYQVLSIAAWTYMSGSGLVATETRDGETTSYTYDAQQRVASITRSPQIGVALTERFQYNSDGQVTLATDAYGRRTIHVYDPRERLVRTVRELVVNGMSGSVSPTAAIRIAGGNPPYEITDRAYNDADELIERVDGRGVRTTYTYDLQGRLQTETRADGTALAATTTYRYDLVGNRTAVTSPRGVTTQMAYTPRNQMCQVIEADGTAEATVVRTVTYTPSRQVATLADALGRLTTYRYESCCDRLTAEEDPLGFVITYGYDAAGRRTSVIDQRTRASATTYDVRDRVTSIANPMAQTTRMAYDDDLADGLGIEAQPLVRQAIERLGMDGQLANGSAVAVTNPAGETAWELRDGVGRPTLRIDPLGRARSYAYDGIVAGLVEVVETDPAAAVTRHQLDAQGNPRVLIDAAGQARVRAYDAVGALLQERDPQGVGVDQTWDVLRRLATRTDTRSPAGTTTWGYDADGNRISETDAAGHTEETTVDQRNRRTAVTDRLGHRTVFTYDEAGHLATISDAENEARRPGVTTAAYQAGRTAYRYDARGLLTGEVLPSGQQGRTLTLYTYDAARRLIRSETGIAHADLAWTSANPDAVTGIDAAYDDAGRLISRTTSDDQATFTYSAAGRLAQARSSRDRTTVAMDHDAAGQVVQETLTIADGRLSGDQVIPAQYPVAMAYDPRGRISAVTLPTGDRITYGFDPRSALETVAWNEQPVLRRSYDLAGRQVQDDAGNGVVTQRTYLPGSHLLAGISGSAMSLAYEYDAVGRKTAERDLHTPERSQRFTYDAASRLVTWQRGAAGQPPANQQSWSLSPVGDWTATERDGEPEQRAHSWVHEAVQVGTADLIYDTRGNLVTDPAGQRFAWDAQNRLVRVDHAIAGVSGRVAYRYDALGRRVAATADGWRTVSVHAGARVVQEQRLLEPAASAALGGDGTADDLARTPDGLDRASGAFLPGPTWTPTAAGVIRIDMLPDNAPRAAGYLSDRGAVFGLRSSGLSYGWSADRQSAARIRGAAALPVWDTLIQLEDATFSVALPDGIYPVIVIAGDAAFTDHTNNLLIGDVAVSDPDPATGSLGYTQGDFDGYAVLATVSGGRLTIAAAAGAVAPRLCLVEIGVEGGAIDAGVQTKLDDYIARLTTATAGGNALAGRTTSFIHGDYLDEVVGYVTTVNGASSRYQVHSNHLYSPYAVTDSSGNVVETYAYDAYGTRTVMTPGGTTLPKSTIGFQRGFTGYALDEEIGLYFARMRMYSSQLGRFISRDPLDYVDGPSLYAGYFAPNELDPSGTCQSGVDCPGDPGYFNNSQIPGYNPDPESGTTVFPTTYITPTPGIGDVTQTVVHNETPRGPAGIANAFVAMGALPTDAGTAVALAGLTSTRSTDPCVKCVPVLVPGRGFLNQAPKGQLVPETVNQGRFYTHYTSDTGIGGIMRSLKIWPSLKAVNPKDARYGNGQYISDILPGTLNPGQLSSRFLTVGWLGSRFTRSVTFDAAGLPVIQGRPGVFVIPGEGPLDLSGRILYSCEPKK